MQLDDKLIKDIEKIFKKMNKENKVKNKAANDDEENVAQELLLTMTVTIKRAFNDFSLDVNRRYIKPAYIKATERFITKPSSIMKLLKVNISNCEVDKHI